MKNKKERLQLIVNLVKKNSIGSQNELAQMLEKNGCRVTQATLSRDLKSMKITKVATNDGGYMYIIPDTNKIHDSMLMSGQRSMTAHQQVGFISIKFSGNIAVIKTRNGYAAGLAYDIDMSHSDEVLGTIAGADTVFAIMDENLSHDDALKFFARFIPVEHE
ncbi:MAG: ArgR family transcriptional regulator [Muribaculaceae bacterium]|jgi:transcriptional regulator of arginine metabolism|nr:ArgR family transcriptional regulator [Muribaculaceae bacterium]